MTPEQVLKKHTGGYFAEPEIQNQIIAAILEYATIHEREVAEKAWLPIETAPRDGQLILITDLDDNGHDSTYVATWSVYNNWWNINAYRNSHLPKPTHWQPLPIK